jgi:hypothetical protein
MERFCDQGNETLESMKCFENYRVAAQLVASRVVPNSTKLVTNLHIHLFDMILRVRLIPIAQCFLDFDHDFILPLIQIAPARPSSFFIE